MVHNEYSLHIDAPPDVVWGVLIDIERWPGWAPHFSRAERLERGDFGLGSSARLRISGAPASVWRVTEFDEGKRFVWASKALGVSSVADHVLEPDGDGTRVALSVTNRGLIATLFSPLFSSLARRNLKAEAQGLKRRSEASPD
jgi:carbon monoxide dehydrogenase subunit G